MGKISDFLAGIKVVEKIESPVNGEVAVIKSLAFGTYLQVAGLTQSGGIIIDIWNKTLKKVKNQKEEGKECLVLGLGGGSIIKVIKKYWPEAHITAVDIDPIMVKLGEKYLGLDKSIVQIYVEDAFQFLTHQLDNLKTNTYDLILVDVYVGDTFPKKFESDEFLKLVRKSLSPQGITVFNRLYYGEKRKESMKFCNKLEKKYKKVEIVFPEANVMFICYY